MRTIGTCLDVLPSGNGFLYSHTGKDGTFSSFDRKKIKDLKRSDVVSFDIISEDDKCFIAANLELISRPEKEKNSKNIMLEEISA